MDTNIVKNDESINKKNPFSLLLKLIVLSVIAIYIFYYKEVDTKRIGQLLYSIPLFNLTMLIIVFLAVETFQVPIMSYLLKPYQIKLSFWTIYKTNLISSFYTISPLGALGGGIVRWYRFSKGSGKRNEVFTAIVIQRVLGILTLLTMGLIVLYYNNPFQHNSHSFFMAIIALSALIAIILMTLSILTHSSITSYIDIKIVRPIIKRLPHFFKEKSQNLWTAIIGYNGGYKPLVNALIFSLIYRVGAFAFYFLSLKMLGVDLKLSNVLVLFFLVYSILEFLPIFSAVGFRESLFIELYSRYRISSEDGISHSLLMFCIIIIVGGVLEITHHIFSKK